MTYRDPGCAYCPPTVRACRQGETEERGPGFCPTNVDADGIGTLVRGGRPGPRNRIPARRLSSSVAPGTAAACDAARRASAAR